MLEVESIDMVGRAFDAAMKRGDAIIMSLGRHVNDHMVSFYVNTPGGFGIEYGTGARLINDDVWTTANYDLPSSWGHQRSLTKT
jgi:3,4-dihydroxy-9,10-secoandrosta-1,3,5(10)-triene-9,17-dione 4,5-dioxygenase